MCDHGLPHVMNVNPKWKISWKKTTQVQSDKDERRLRQVLADETKMKQGTGANQDYVMCRCVQYIVD